jgi:hypothetical protein
MTRFSTLRLSAAIGGIALSSVACASQPQVMSYAGEALDIERPSIRTPTSDVSPQAMPAFTVALPGTSVPATRAEVVADLRAAQQAGAMTPAGEGGDMAKVIAARDAMNAEQERAIIAAYAIEAPPVALLPAPVTPG